MTKRSWVRILAVSLSCYNSGHVVHTRASVTKQYILMLVMLDSWKVPNCRFSGPIRGMITLPMLCTLKYDTLCLTSVL